jgi:hypothetical protein
MNPRAHAAVAAALLLATGCSRTFYRQQADADAYCLTDAKATVVGAAPPTYRIEVDPRSRMYDPNNPDVEPMPPDDPVSHRYMEVVDRKKGSKLWNELPRTSYVENPDWQQYLPRNERGEVQLDLRAAAETALINSTDYQAELEDLYLSALDVSFERFRFDTQFFGGSSVFVTADGRARGANRDGVPGTNSNTVLEVSPLRAGNPLEARRLTATGGEFVVGAANSLVWQFAGPNDYRGTTLLDFTFLQPLLRGGGRTRVLETLTISERSLLANVRQMERYRRGFYLSVATGQQAGEGPSRRGGFFGGSGLQGFTGVGGGGFGNVGNFSATSAISDSSAGFSAASADSKASAAASPAAPARSRPAASSASCKPNSSSATSARTSSPWATATNNCRPPTTPAASTGFKSIWPVRPSTTRKASCSLPRPDTKRCSTISRSRSACRPSCRSPSTIPISTGSTCSIPSSRPSRCGFAKRSASSASCGE